MGTESKEYRILEHCAINNVKKNMKYIYKYVFTGVLLLCVNVAYPQAFKLPTKKPGAAAPAKKATPAPAVKKPTATATPAKKAPAVKSSSPVPTRKPMTVAPTRKSATGGSSARSTTVRNTTTNKSAVSRRTTVSHASRNYTYSEVRNKIPVADILSMASVSDMSTLLCSRGFTYNHVGPFNDSNHYVWTINSTFSGSNPESVRPSGNGISCMVENCETLDFSGMRITVFNESVKKHLQSQLDEVHRYRGTKFVLPWADGEYYDYSLTKTGSAWVISVYGAYFGAHGSVETLANADAQVTTYSSSGSSAVYDMVEQQPSFPGGAGALNRWLAENVKYPARAAEEGIEGRVIVQFIVGTDGSITNARVVRSVNQYLDKEALRVVSVMPRWKPGMQDGKPVRVRYTVPVTFRLS